MFSPCFLEEDHGFQSINQKKSALERFKGLPLPFDLDDNFDSPNFKRPQKFRDSGIGMDQSPSELMLSPELDDQIQLRKRRSRHKPRRLQVTKRSRDSDDDEVPPPKRHSPTLEISDNEVELVGSEGNDTIGDFSRPYSLPTIPGKHGDLKSITADTVSQLLDDGQATAAFAIIDCRYPFEFDGGHIQGAINIWNQNQMRDFYHNQSTQERIIMLHCEFSSERGPRMSRYLRQLDRSTNRDAYPWLNFPEMYLIHCGYETFHESHRDQCEPQKYTRMLDVKYATELKQYRTIAKAARSTTSRRRQLHL